MNNNNNKRKSRLHWFRATEIESESFPKHVSIACIECIISLFWFQSYIFDQKLKTKIFNVDSCLAKIHQLMIFDAIFISPIECISQFWAAFFVLNLRWNDTCRLFDTHIARCSEFRTKFTTKLMNVMNISGTICKFDYFVCESNNHVLNQIHIHFFLLGFTEINLIEKREWKNMEWKTFEKYLWCIIYIGSK